MEFITLFRGLMIPCNSIIQFLLDKKVFSESEGHFMEAVKNYYHIEDEKILSLFGLLFLYFRLGHVSIRFAEKQIQPSLDQVIKLELKVEELQFFEALWIQTRFQLPISLLNSPELKEEITPLVAEGEHLYLRKAYFSETQLLIQINRWIHAELPPLISSSSSDEKLKKLLNSEQMVVWRALLKYPLTFLLGGPGTGKSHTIHAVMTTFCDLFSYVPRIIVAAPTGKAVLRLKQYIQEKTPLGIQVSTLHSLLKIGSFVKTYIEADLIIIDECSMIDLMIWEKLFSALQPGTRVLLVGDVDQLPPVEAGAIFTDLSEYFSKFYPDALIRLKTNLRIEEKEIVDFAQSIQTDAPKIIIEKLKTGFPHLVYHPNLDCDIVNWLCQLYSKSQAENRSLGILSPMNEGVWGIEQLNKKIQKFLTQKNPQASYPIMITKNDYAKELFNGEVGIVKYVEGEVYPRAYFSHGREYPLSFLSFYTLAYVISVHKSQGSEYNEVILLIPDGFSKFGKELLYTAVTRAKKKLTLVGKEDELYGCLQKSGRKYSQLAARLEQRMSNQCTLS